MYADKNAKDEKLDTDQMCTMKRRKGASFRSEYFDKKSCSVHSGVLRNVSSKTRCHVREKMVKLQAPACGKAERRSAQSVGVRVKRRGKSSPL